MRRVLAWAVGAVCLFAAEVRAADHLQKISNDAGAVVAALQDNGDLVLKGNLLEAQAGPDAAGAVWAVKDDGGNALLAIDAAGGMEIKGELRLESDPAADARLGEIVLDYRDDAGNAVARLDVNGHLTIRGYLFEQIADPAGPLPPIVRFAESVVEASYPGDIPNGVELSEYLYNRFPDGVFDSNPDAASPGAVFADLNNDCRPDLYLMQPAGKANRLYLNNGDGTFAFHAMPDDPAEAVNFNSTGATAADYDNDGDLDIYLVTGAYMNGAGTPLREPGITLGLAADEFTDNDGSLRNLLLKNQWVENEGAPYWESDCIPAGGMGLAFEDVTGAPNPDAEIGSLGLDNQAYEDTMLQRFFITLGFPGDQLQEPPEEEDPMLAAPISSGNSYTAAWGDVNRDGWPDLYVGNWQGTFPAFDEGDDNPDGDPDTVNDRYGMLNTLYLNVTKDFDNVDSPNREFIDVTDLAKVDGIPMEPDGEADEIDHKNLPGERYTKTSTFVCTFADFNNDRWPDLFVANEAARDAFYINPGLANTAAIMHNGVNYDVPIFAEERDAADPTGDFGFGWLDGAPMGVDVGDVDNDGDLDIYVSDQTLPPDAPNGQPLSNNLYVNLFVEEGTPAGSVPRFENFGSPEQVSALFSWGNALADFDNDGDVDVYAGTGEFDPFALFDPFSDFVLRNNWVANGGASASFTNLTAKPYLRDPNPTGLDLVEEPDLQRVNATVIADYDHDGKVDMFTVTTDAPDLDADGDGNPDLFFDPIPNLYRNATTGSGSWLHVQAVGRLDGAGLTRNVLGTRIIVEGADVGDAPATTDVDLIREVRSGMGASASSNSLVQFFGLGQEAGSVTLRIYWATEVDNHKETVMTGVPINQAIRVKQEGSPDTGGVVTGTFSTGVTLGIVDALY